MTGCVAKFVASVLDAETNDDKMYRSWSLLPFILPAGKCFAAYAQLIGNRGYDLAASALKGTQHEG